MTDNRLGLGISALTGPMSLVQKLTAPKYIDFDTAQEFISHALDRGVRFFATDSIEGLEDEEKVFGDVLEGRRNDVQICTKIGLTADKTHNYGVDYFKKRLEQSLLNLKTDYIDLLQINKISGSELAAGGLIEESVHLKEQGVIRAFGVSCNSVEHAEAVLDITGCDCVQVQFNLGVREMSDKKLPGTVIVKSPMWSGMLSIRALTEPNFPPADRRAEYLDKKELASRRKEIRGILEALDWPQERIAELSVRYLMSHDNFDVVLFGSSRTQFEEIFSFAEKGKLEDETLRIISEFGTN